MAWIIIPDDAANEQDIVRASVEEPMDVPAGHVKVDIDNKWPGEAKKDLKWMKNKTKFKDKRNNQEIPNPPKNIKVKKNE